MIKFIQHFFKGLNFHLEAIPFIRRHRVWEGFWNYSWVTKGLMVLGMLSGLVMISKLWGFFNIITHSDSAQALGANLAGSVADFGRESYKFLFMGGMKYVILVFSEILIFHVIKRTIEILTEQELDGSFNAFWEAQIRMIKIAFRSWILELLFTIGISIVLGIVGFKFLKPVLVFTVQAYFLGFAFVDNYNERFEMSIEESAKMAKNYLGLCIAVGMIAYIFLLVPIVGAIVAPIVGAVTATLAMHYLKQEEMMAME